jgi:hypothetical protein
MHRAHTHATRAGTALWVYAIRTARLCPMPMHVGHVTQTKTTASSYHAPRAFHRVHICESLADALALAGRAPSCAAFLRCLRLSFGLMHRPFPQTRSQSANSRAASLRSPVVTRSKADRRRFSRTRSNCVRRRRTASGVCEGNEHTGKRQNGV